MTMYIHTLNPIQENAKIVYENVTGNLLNQKVDNAQSVRTNPLIQFDEDEKGQCFDKALI